MLLIFCGNNRRQRLWHGWRDKPFANDHLDAFFNASVDAGIALTAAGFVLPVAAVFFAGLLILIVTLAVSSRRNTLP